MSNNEVFIEEIQEVTDKIFKEFEKKIHCNPKEFQREGVVGVVLMREEKAFSEKKKKKKLQVAPNCAALRVLYFSLVVVTFI